MQETPNEKARIRVQCQNGKWADLSETQPAAPCIQKAQSSNLIIVACLRNSFTLAERSILPNAERHSPTTLNGLRNPPRTALNPHYANHTDTRPPDPTKPPCQTQNVYPHLPSENLPKQPRKPPESKVCFRRKKDGHVTHRPKSGVLGMFRHPRRQSLSQGWEPSAVRIGSC